MLSGVSVVLSHPNLTSLSEKFECLV